MDISNFTHYPDSSLCSFYIVGLNNTARAKLSGEGPRGSFAVFAEWVLVSNGSSFTIGPADEDAISPTPDPESSLPSPHRTEQLLEPTADGEPMLATNSMPEPGDATVHVTAPELEPQLSSDQVHEPATTPIFEGAIVEYEVMRGSPAALPPLRVSKYRTRIFSTVYAKWIVYFFRPHWFHLA